MADGVTLPGTGDLIAADDLAAFGKVQWLKLIDGTNGGTDVIPGSAARGLYVDPRIKAIQPQVASAGLTTASTAYTAGDQLGTILDFANAVRASGGTATIQSAVLVDKAKIVGAIDLYLFDRSVSLVADNAAADISDADMLFCVGKLSFPAPATLANNGLATIESSGLHVWSNATSVFGVLVTRAAHTFFGAAGDLVVTLGIIQD